MRHPVVRMPVVLGLPLVVAMVMSVTPAAAAMPPDCPNGIEYVEGLGRACEVREGLFQLESDLGSGVFTHGGDPWIPEIEPTWDTTPEAVRARLAKMNGSHASASDGDGSQTVNATPSDPTCVTDPAAYQTVVTYAHAPGEGQFSTRAPQIRNLVREANGRLNEEVATFGGSGAYRVMCSGSTITVLDAEVAITSSGTTFSDVVDALRTLNPAIYENLKYKHWIWCECRTTGASGTGTLWADDDLSVSNRNNGSRLTHAIQWGHCCGHGPSTGFFGSRTWMHELGHNMGAVMGNPAAVDMSPNSSGTGYHCNDGRDVMCYDDGGSHSAYNPNVCGLINGNDQWDCNNDDYFSPAPAPGSYLATHWNLASCHNRFLTLSYCPEGLSFNTSSITVPESVGSFNVTIQRPQATLGAVGVTVASVNGSATAGSDFVGVSTTRSLAAGVVSTTLSVTINDDAAAEGSETFTLALSSPTGGATLGPVNVVTVTITDNDVPPGVLSLSASNQSVGEGDGSVTVTVSRTGGTGGTVGATLSTSDGTATAPGDYTAKTDTVSLEDGVTSASFVVSVAEDALDESDETFTVTLASPTGGATLGATITQTVTIIDNDGPSVIAFDIADGPEVDEADGAVDVSVIRSGATGAPASASFSVGGIAPGAPSDGTVSFGVGESAKVISIDPDDDIFTGDRTITLTLSAPVGATLGASSTHTFDVVEDEVQPLLSFEASTIEVDEGVGSVDIVVSRTGAPANSVGATLSRTGTATPPGDLAQTPASVNLSSGQTQETITVVIEDDAVPEGAETIVLTLSSPSGGAALGAISQLTLTISASDHQPDGMVAKRTSGPFRGNDVINATAAGQTMGKNGRKGVSKTFYWRLENEGPTLQTFVLDEIGRQRGLNATYFFGGSNVTSLVRAGMPVEIKPGALRTVRVVLKYTRTFPNRTKRFLRLEASFEPLVEDTRDVVKLQLLYRVPKRR